MKLTAFFLATLLSGSGGQVYESSAEGVTKPVPTKVVHAQYAPGALRARVQGRVGLRAVVSDDGRVGDVEVTNALHPDLDAACVTALKQWKFKPGTREGKPVSVRVSVDMSFSMRR